MKKALLLLTVFVSTIGIQSVQADLQSDITSFFTMLSASKDDSGYGEINQLMIPYKRNKSDLKQLLGAKKTINGIANTTPLHLAVQGNNYGISGVMFQKASSLEADYSAFALGMINAVDAKGKRPVDYSKNTKITDMLNSLATSLSSSSSSSSSSSPSSSGTSSSSNSPSSSSTSSSSASSSQTSLSVSDEDITNFFNFIKVKNSTSAKAITKKYKNISSSLEKLFSAERTMDGVNKTTPLHYAAKYNDYLTAIDMLVKASNVNSAFGSTLAKKVDGAGKRPIDYTATDLPMRKALAPLSN